MPRYAISDIHGCHQTFLHLLDEIHFSKTDELFLLGDYIDRGPDSYGVIQTILRLQDTGHTIHCLRGNHEQMMLDALDSIDGEVYRLWLRNGGNTTIHSIRDRDSDALLRWMDALPYHLESPGYLMVHAGLQFGFDPLQDTRAMLWKRDWYDQIDHEWLDGRIILHGHTPMAHTEIRRMLERVPQKRVLDLDAGCVFTHRAKYGRLCAFNMDERELTFVEKMD